jgi:ABC-2 type transport system ATP-binding protein
MSMSVKVTNVTKLFGSQKALDSVSFDIKKGEVAGFIGPNGAGKSTMMKIITGFIPANEGSVSVCGLQTGPGAIELRRLIGYLPENNPLYPEMYVREYLGYVADIYKMGRGKEKAVDTVIEKTGLGPEQGKKIIALSKGYRQRVGLAQALIHDPSVLILDEATTGLDPNQIIEIRNLISGIGKEKTVMLSTHIMQEVEAICSRVIIIDHGKIVADGTRESISALAGEKKIMIAVEFDREIKETDLMGITGVVSVLKTGNNSFSILSSADMDIRPLIFAFAVNKGLTVLGMHKQEESLEDTFRQLTGK